jgi:hypothetical protein
MSIIYTETKSDKDSRTEIDIGDGRMLTINITGEGIIMDVWKKADDVDEIGSALSCDEHLGTAGMMFDEWADWVGGLMPRAYQMPDPTKANVR